LRLYDCFGGFVCCVIDVLTLGYLCCLRVDSVAYLVFGAYLDFVIWFYWFACLTLWCCSDLVGCCLLWLGVLVMVLDVLLVFAGFDACCLLLRCLCVA